MFPPIAHSLESKIRTRDVISERNITFESLLLPKNILKGLTDSGFKKPSPIQVKAIPFGRCGFDLIVKSKSGTGKTLVFSVIALETIETSKIKPEVLILVPTREIAVQIKDVIQSIGCHIEGLKVESFIGGFSIEGDREKCKKCHIAVGAPGRIKHLINEAILETNAVRLFVLDEADKLMESSFENDINAIYNSLPQRKQIITTSATYPNELETFLSKYMLSPTSITSEIDTPLLLGLKQFVKIVKPPLNVVQGMKAKNEELLNILSNFSFTQCLVFSNYQTRAESISNFLNQKGWNSSFISAAQSQTDRLTALSNLKNFKCRILLSTDLTARGIDAANVDLVINYDIPIDAMTYLHRMGRAGRYGSMGICLNLAFDGNELLVLQKILGTIGGSSLSIPKLPDFKGTLMELLNMEISLEDSIYGTVNVDEEKSIKGNIFEIKQMKYNSKNVSKESTNNVTRECGEITENNVMRNTTGRKNSGDLNMDFKLNNEKHPSNSKPSFLNDDTKGDVKTIKKTCEAREENDTITRNNVGDIINLLSTSKGDIKEINEKFSGVGTSSLLNLMASGELKVGSKVTSQVSLPNCSLLQLLSNEEDKKRKRSDAENLKMQSNIVPTFKKESKEFGNQFSHVNTTSVLSLLASGDLKAAANIVSENCLKNGISPQPLSHTEEDYTKRKKLLGKEHHEETDTMVLLKKNKALLSVSKLLVNDKTKAENTDVETIQNYLDSLKQQETEKIFEVINKNKSASSMEMLDNVDELQTIFLDESKWDMENIFKDGFEAIVKSDKRWRNLVPDSEIRKFEELCLKENDDSDEEIQDSEYSGCCMEEGNYDEKINYNENDINDLEDENMRSVNQNVSEESSDFMKWVPVEKSQDTQVVPACTLYSENVGYEYFNSYFDECNDSLWQNGLAFGNVEAFDDWFHYEWQAQVFAIRNYVQQKIYLEEMNQFQKSGSSRDNYNSV